MHSMIWGGPRFREKSRDISLIYFVEISGVTTENLGEISSLYSTAASASRPLLLSYRVNVTVLEALGGHRADTDAPRSRASEFFAGDGGDSTPAGVLAAADMLRSGADR